MRYEKGTFQTLVVFRFDGEFSGGTGAENLMRDLTAELRQGGRKFVFDLAHVGYVNSSGIRVLLRAKQLIEADQGVLGLVSLQKNILKVFNDLNIAGMFPHFPSLQDAASRIG